MIERISDRSVFDRFRAEGTRSRAGALTLVRLDRPEATRPAVAFALSRRVGGAVQRNRLRRQLRTAFRELAAEGRAGTAAWLVIPSPNAVGASYATLSGWLDRAVARAEEVRQPCVAP